VQRISTGSLDAGLAVAAHRLIAGSLGVVSGERIVVVVDAAHRPLADTIRDAVIIEGSQAMVFCLEDLAPRPHRELHATIKEALAHAQASVLLIDFEAGELQMRTDMVDLAAHHRLRHGHMVGVTRASMVAGFSVDPHRIAEKARALSVRLRRDSRITLKSAAGTDLVIDLSPRCRWLDYGCIVAAGKRVNLPGGELVTSPETVNGSYVATGTLGDADGVLRRSLMRTPVTLRISSSRVTGVECAEDRQLARTIQERMFRLSNLDRVGLVGFGLNLGLNAPVGDVFTDQKVPGVHLSLGETFPDKTGATWTSESWLAFTAVELDADVDKLPVLRRGRYLI
jgi:aminopeptidase